VFEAAAFSYEPKAGKNLVPQHYFKTQNNAFFAGIGSICTK
jgi:hypothetical protein